MTTETKPKKTKSKSKWVYGLAVGIVLSVMMVLASGFMIDMTNKDTFCVTCHIMIPFQQAWRESVHGGKNPQGFTAQCVDCHLPHGDFFQFLVAKAVTGTGDVIHNLYIDAEAYDWMGASERRRLKFTYDSACRHCHNVLTPPGMRRGGFLAHRSYLRGDTKKRCTECHPHVGHKNMADAVNRYFNKREI